MVLHLQAENAHISKQINTIMFVWYVTNLTERNDSRWLESRSDDVFVIVIVFVLVRSLPIIYVMPNGVVKRNDHVISFNYSIQNYIGGFMVRATVLRKTTLAVSWFALPFYAALERRGFMARAAALHGTGTTWFHGSRYRSTRHCKRRGCMARATALHGTGATRFHNSCYCAVLNSNKNINVKWGVSYLMSFFAKPN
jgi:hypothetical protein